MPGIPLRGAWHDRIDRGGRTLVYLDFKALPDNRTELTLRNFGYGDGEEWAKNKAYFAQAWPAVMTSLEKRFAPK